MGLVSLGLDVGGVERFTTLRLTRKEAAKYVGVTDSAIRDAERRGLPHVVANSGQVWLAADDLEAWRWRAPLPSLAKRRAVLAAAEKARGHEARILAQLEEKRLAALEREEAEETERFLAYLAEEDRLRDEVRAKNDAARADFLHRHVDERAAGLALGLGVLERRRRLRELKAAGLLREVESPREPIVASEPGAIPCIKLSPCPLVAGGPFYIREDVVRLRSEQHARQVQVVQAGAARAVDEPALFWHLVAEFVRGATGR